MDQYVAGVKAMLSDNQIDLIVDLDDPGIDLDLRRLSPEFLVDTFGIDTLESVEQFTTGELPRPDALAIVGDVWRDFSEADVRWLRDAYQSGMPVGFVNVTIADLNGLMGFHCRSRWLNFNDYPDPIDYWVATAFYVDAVLESDRQAFIEARARCAPTRGIAGRRPLDFFVSHSINTLEHEVGGIELISALALAIDSIHRSAIPESERRRALKWLGIND